MTLFASPCRRLCDWRPTRAASPGPRLFACTGCGSQWRRGEAWSPRQADGSWPPEVARELGLTSGPGAAGAGTAGS